MIRTEADLASIRWPQQCAYCNDQAASFVRTVSRAVQEAGHCVFFVTYTSRVVEIAFPVCKAHKTRARLASALAQRRLVSLGLGVLTAFAMLGAATDLYRLFFSPEPYEAGWTKTGFLYVFPAVYWTIFYWAKKSAPVIVQELGGKIVLHFANDEFGLEFRRLNAQK